MDHKTAETWLETTEIGELVSAIELSAELASGVPYDVMQWKWLILALHHALQGALVCALRGNDPAATAMLTPGGARALRNWNKADARHRASRQPPAAELLPLAALYRRACDSAYVAEGHALPTDAGRDAAVAKLVRLHQDLRSFIPGGFSLEVDGLPNLVRSCCDMIEHLAVSHPTFWRHLQRVEKKRIDFALATLRKAMGKWEARR